MTLMVSVEGEAQGRLAEAERLVGRPNHVTPDLAPSALLVVDMEEYALSPCLSFDTLCGRCEDLS